MIKKLSFILFFLSCFAFTQAQTYLVSVVPQFPRLVLYEDWQPLLNYLTEETGYTFELDVKDSIPDFETSFLAGEPDFAFMNPYHMVMAKQAEAYEPLLSDASRQLKGILIVSQSGPYQTVQDLNGQTLVFPSPNAFGASLYMRALLKESEGIEFSSSYVDTHSNAYRHVLHRQAAAGGGVQNTLNKEPEALQEQLHVLYETPGVTPHPLAVHPRVSADVQTAVKEAILRLRDSEAGLELLVAVQLREVFEVSYEEHFAFLEDLNLENYLVLDSE